MAPAQRKDKSYINVVAKEAMKTVGIYYYFFPTYSQGRKILWDGLDRDGFKFLDHIPGAIRAKKPNEAEMKITLVNGSIFQVIGTDNIDSVVGTNPRGCVFSEYSLQNPAAWEYMRPILAENDGWAAFNCCVKKDTLVMTRNGIERIGRMPHNEDQRFTDVSTDVYGKNGFHRATSFYNGGAKELVKLTTSRGYVIEGTPNHPIWTGEEWRRLDAHKVGDPVVIQRNQQVWGCDNLHGWTPPKIRKSKHPFNGFGLNEDLMYLMGLILAEGNWDNSGTVTISNQDAEIRDFLKNTYEFAHRDDCHSRRHNKRLVSFIDWFGIKRGAKNKRIPDRLMRMPKKYISAFLSGYFDGDGSSHDKKGWIHCDSVSEALITDLQVLLLNYGIISKKTKHKTKPTKRVKVSSVAWRLSFDGYNAELFYSQIGFRLTRKQAHRNVLPKRCRDWWGDTVTVPRKRLNNYIRGMNETDLKRHTPVTYRTLRRLLEKKDDPYIRGIVEDNYYYDTIASIEHTRGKVYDFVIPDTHSFFSNGLISHNTPRGENHAYDLYQRVKDNPEWFTETLTVDDTHAISLEAIERERKDGMSEEMIRQEFYCSWAVPVPGAYFANELMAAERDGRIGRVPIEPNIPVNTYWDLGIDDSTTVWFAQTVGREVHFVNYYSNSGEGLVHYANYLKDWRDSKRLTFGVHVLPHDGNNRQLQTGKTTKEFLSELGITCETVPRVKKKEDGIEASRQFLGRSWFDADGCKDGLSALKSYRKEYNEKYKIYGSHPVHDWSSHGADGYQTASLYHHVYGRDKMSEPITIRIPHIPKSAQSWMGV